MSSRVRAGRMRKANKTRNDRLFERFMKQHNEACAARQAEQADAQRAEDEAFADRFISGMMAGLEMRQEGMHG